MALEAAEEEGGEGVIGDKDGAKGTFLPQTHQGYRDNPVVG